MKKIVIISISVVIILFFVIAAKNQIINTIVSIAAKKVIGADVRIGSLSFGIFKHRVVINNLKVYNPTGFPKEILLDLPKIRVDYDLPSLLKKQVYLKHVEVNLRELVVIKNKEGQLNVNSLKVSQKQEAKAKEKPAEAMPFKIDYLVLTINKVIYKDYSKGEKPDVRFFDINIKNKAYKNITSVNQLVSLLLIESMRSTTIRGASIYGAASLAGAVFLPAAAVGLLTADDSSDIDIHASFEQAFKVSLEVINGLGKVKKEDEKQGVILANVEGSDVTVKITPVDNKTVKLKVSARKFFLADEKLAGNILYQIKEKLGK
ncbi:MAG: hypothetical protein ABIH18_05065 [Candidatus Omnitrophota bacterium]